MAEGESCLAVVYEEKGRGSGKRARQSTRTRGLTAFSEMEEGRKRKDILLLHLPFPLLFARQENRENRILNRTVPQRQRARLDWKLSKGRSTGGEEQN